MTYRPTRRLAGVLLAAGLIYGAAVNSLVVWLYAVCAMLLALVPLGLLGPWWVLRKLRVDGLGVQSGGFVAPFPRDRAKIFLGDLVQVPVSGTGIAYSDVIVLKGSSGDLETRFDNGSLYFPARECGRFHAETLEVQSGWPWNLSRVRCRIPFALDVTVYPRYAIAPVAGGNRGGIGGVNQYRSGESDEMIAVRQYRSGDNRRHIHWLTTARVGELMVVQRAAPALSALHCALILDEGESLTAVEAMATLLAGCVVAQRPFRMRCGSGPPARLWHDALTRLALARPQPVPRTSAGVEVVVRAKQGGAEISASGNTVFVPAGAGLEEIAAVFTGLGTHG